MLDANAHAMQVKLCKANLQPLPLIKISSRDLQDLLFLEKGGINLSFPRSILFTVIVPHHLIELNDLTPCYSFHLF